MRWSKTYLKTFKEKPSHADTEGHSLLLRAGYIHSISSGIFIYNSLFLRSLFKLTKLIRKELEKEGACEILMPMVQPKSLWEETGRWDKFDDLLLKSINHSEQEFCLGPTHEEVVTAFVRSGLNSYRDMPFNVYQIQTKYRDEIRPRFGLMRAREFLMKDAYSFDRNEQDSLKSYASMYKAYTQIFKNLGVEFTVVEADTGNIGGKKSQEFHILAERGEDVLLISESGSFSINREICPSLPRQIYKKEARKKIEELSTPGIKSIDSLSKFLKCKKNELVKILFIRLTSSKKALEYVALLCQGDDEINLVKVKTFFKKEACFATEKEVYELSGAEPGSCGPVNLDCPVYVDHKLKNKSNFVTGANKTGFHFKNVNFEDFKVQAYIDITLAKEGDPSPDGQGQLKEKRGIEVGHLFYLSDTYSRAMNLKYQDEQGRQKYVEMGCYGLGITRTLQAIVEQNHDSEGITWPVSVAPFLVHIVLLDPKDSLSSQALDKLTSELDKLKIDYFIDDRQERPGIKFKDADLIGLPYRINIGKRDISENQIEFVLRSTREKEKLSIEASLLKLKNLII